jgi:hypothetical protein
VDEKNPGENNKVRKMEDVELVLRYFALRYEGHERIKRGFKDFLTSSLNTFNGYSEKQINDRSQEFVSYMEFILDVMGPMAFSKWRGQPGELTRMSSFNAAVYDAVVVGLASVVPVSKLDRAALKPKLDNLRNALFPNHDFFEAVSGSVNDANKVAKRIQLVVEYLR